MISKTASPLILKRAIFVVDTNNRRRKYGCQRAVTGKAEVSESEPVILSLRPRGNS